MIKVVARLQPFTLVTRALVVGQGFTVSLASRRYGSQFGIDTLKASNNLVTPVRHNRININQQRKKDRDGKNTETETRQQRMATNQMA